MAGPRVAFLVPGIFGSSLHVVGQGEIWGPNFYANYSRIANSAAILAWKGSQVPSRLMLEANARPPWLPFKIYKQKLWSEVIDTLDRHPEFGPGSTFQIGYDWRDSLLNLSATFADQVKATLASVSSDRNEIVKAVLITHSMGGLLARVAVSKGQLLPDQIDRVIHIGTPLTGAPGAFSSLYGELRFPFLDRYLRWIHGKEFVRFRENLFVCVRTFQSAWELLPQDSMRYVQHYGRTRHINPLSERYIDPVHVSRARQVHALVNQAEGILGNANVPVHKIYTDSHQVTTEQAYQ